MRGGSSGSTLGEGTGAANAFWIFLAEVRADGVPSKVEIVRSDNGGEFFGGEFGEVCKQFSIKQESTNADSPKQNLSLIHI